ncbi:MAG: DUF6702 family protein [Gemmatimonadaceae bacterium]
MNARRMAAAIAATLLGVCALPRSANAHPLHSTITELTEDRARGVVRAMVRVFADDFGTAVARSAGGRVSPASGAAWDAATLAYATSVFGFQDAQGRPIALRSCGIRRAGELVWVCLEGTTAQPLAALRVRNAVLCDLFEDQVNVVQGTAGGERRSLLFVRGDRFKPVR